jgi:hypothetical protein
LRGQSPLPSLPNCGESFDPAIANHPAGRNSPAAKVRDVLLIRAIFATLRLGVVAQS